METPREGSGSEFAIDQALALAAGLTPATALLVETGATQTRWGVDDPGGHLPIVKALVLTRDATADGQFGSHAVVKALQVRSLVGLPLQASDHLAVDRPA